MQFITGHFEQDGDLIYIPIGFIPDKFDYIDFHTSTNIVIAHWWKFMEDDFASGLQEGFTVKEGVTARLADDGGIVGYDTGTQAPTIEEYSVARSTAATARTVTTRGTLLRPSSDGINEDGQKADRSLIVECVTAGTGSAEPVYPVSIGGQVLGNDVLYEVVNQATFRAGYQGVRIAGALMTDGQEGMFDAWQADPFTTDLGDVASWPDGIQGS